MKKRTISGLVILLIIFGSMFLNIKLFSIVIAIVAILGFRELVSIKYGKSSSFDIIKYFGYIFVTFITLNNVFWTINSDIFILISLLLILIPIVIYNNSEKYNINDALYILGAVYFVSYSFHGIIKLNDVSIAKCAYVFVVSFVTDTYAYIGGSFIGKHKLSNISPNKTIEGSIIGTVMGSIMGCLFYYFLIGDISIYSTLFMSFSLSIISEIGDLVFSSIKRYFDKKDYSNLIPGHGGILDRFDSVIFVSLLFNLIISFM